MFVLRPSLFTLPLLVFAACQTAPEIPGRFEKLGKGFCECTRTLVEANQNVRQDAATAQDLEKIAAAFQQTKDCVTTLVGQFGKLSEDELMQLQPMLSKHCPAMAGDKNLLRELLGNQ